MWFENTIIALILLLATWYVINQVGLLRLGRKSSKSNCNGCGSGSCQTPAISQSPGERTLPMR